MTWNIRQNICYTKHMDIRPATLDDIEDVARILTVIRMKPITASDIERVFEQTVASPQADVLIAFKDNVAVGIGVLNCVLKLNRIECRLDEVIVLPEARGSGIGRGLVEACNQWAWDKGCYKIEFTSRNERVGSLAFYEKLGYKKRESNIYAKFSPTTDYIKTQVT